MSIFLLQKQANLFAEVGQNTAAKPLLALSLVHSWNRETVYSAAFLTYSVERINLFSSLSYLLCVREDMSIQQSLLLLTLWCKGYVYSAVSLTLVEPN